MNMQEVRETARKKLKGYCRVCPVCNGKVCAGEMPGMGGCGTGDSFMENVRALAAYKLNLRTLHGVTSCDTTLNLWGTTFASPIMGAPMTGVSYNLGGATSEAEMAEAIQCGCQAIGSMSWSGDGVDPAMFGTGLQAIKENKGRGIPTIKPRETSEIIKRIRMAEDAGALAVAVDVDAACFHSMGAQGQPVGPTKPEQIAELVASTPLPLILKGIMTVDEACLAASLGVAGIVVSNHGGRSLDASRGTADVLSSIAAAVKGKTRIFFDGGVRTGSDVLKALALGAEGVLVGRPLIVGGAGGGTEGVRLVMQTMHDDLVRSMVLTGTANVREVPPSVVVRA